MVSSRNLLTDALPVGGGFEGAARMCPWLAPGWISRAEIVSVVFALFVSHFHCTRGAAVGLYRSGWRGGTGCILWKLRAGMRFCNSTYRPPALPQIVFFTNSQAQEMNQWV